MISTIDIVSLSATPKFFSSQSLIFLYWVSIELKKDEKEGAEKLSDLWETCKSTNGTSHESVNLSNDTLQVHKDKNCWVQTNYNVYD